MLMRTRQIVRLACESDIDMASRDTQIVANTLTMNVDYLSSICRNDDGTHIIYSYYSNNPCLCGCETDVLVLGGSRRRVNSCRDPPMFT